ncbi:MAG: ABC transporter ATP-binding protein/permease [Clostridium sp.]|nr:ABC transporter ATP-binding protein/permease [Clostridium sp.]
MLYLEKVFSDKSRQKYGLISNYIYNLKAAKEWDKKLFWGQIAVVIPTVAAPLLSAWLPSRLVFDLTGQIPFPRLALEMALISLVLWICNAFANMISEYCYFEGNFISTYYAKKYVHKVIDVDYDYLEDAAYQKIYGNAWRVAQYGQGVSRAMSTFSIFTSSFVGTVIYGFILAQKSLILLLTLTASLSISLYLLSFVRKKHAAYYEKLQLPARKESYISAAATNSAAGKDIRLYRLAGWFLEKYDASLQEIGNTYGIIHHWYLFRNVSHAFLQLLMDGAAFGLLVVMLTKGALTTAQFVFYIGIVSSFSLSFENVLRSVMNFSNTSASISYIREFLETKDTWKRTDGIGADKLAAFQKDAVKVELRNVSFTYPGKKEPALKNINAIISPGEKVALIGLNGAGKTTLVKLICGFYHPTEGEILINDIPASAYTRDEYYSLVSVLFQDSAFLARTLDENLTGQNTEDIDRARLSHALKLSGFQSVYDALPKKGRTLLVQEVNENSTNFSGGEKQKLLFARALYQNTPLVILDEPTAALDPIAENELYLNYGKSMEHKTSIYISHRLSSTRFCDRILLLEHGEIIEEGTHESLLAEKSRYAELFETQSQYYKDEIERKRKSELMGDTYQTKADAERGVFDE